MKYALKSHELMVLTVLLSSLSPASLALAFQPEAVFKGTYAEMDPEQQRLIDDWFERFNRVMGENLDPEQGFDLLPLSTKTTYQAVTNALLTTELTDQQGNSLGNTLELVLHVETVKGKVKGAGGDQQFRMYCQLKPVARELLDKSREFNRGHDNTVYHKGYPLNYRQQGGVPSMQISMSKDGERADVDVDYRSSKFPAALLNGHLTSSNSDVRAGNNFDRHTARWTGLQNWWADWFSIPFVKDESISEEHQGVVIPAQPPKGRGQIQEAAYDFLDTWLVERTPEVAMSYISSRAFKCIEAELDGSLDMGMAPFQILVGMRRTNQLLGQISKVDEIVQGIRLFDPEVRVVQQSHHDAFVLYDLPESRAIEFECANRGRPASEVPQGSKSTYGKYFGTVFFVQVPGGHGETLALLWAREGGNWKIISWESEPESDSSDVPDLRSDIPVGTAPRVNGKPEQISAAAGFLEAWFLEKNYDRTLGYFADEGLQCVNLFLEEGEQPFEGIEKLKQRLRLGLERTAEAFSAIENLSDVMTAFEPVNPDYPIVTHSREADFTSLSVPDYLAGNYGCAYRLAGGELLPAPESPQYGNHYVLGFHTKTYTGEPAVLFTLWAQRSGVWKITSFHIERP